MKDISVKKNSWDMSKDELIESRKKFVAYFTDLDYEPSKDALAQYEILIKLEEIKELIRSKTEKVFYAHRHETFEKLNQVRDIIHI